MEMASLTKEQIKEMMKKDFEAIVCIEFNDFVYEVLLTMVRENGNKIVRDSLYVLKERRNKINDYRHLMALLVSICKNQKLQKKELKHI